VVCRSGRRRGSGEPQPFGAAAHGLIGGLRLAGVRRPRGGRGRGQPPKLAPGSRALDPRTSPRPNRANALAQREALEVYRDAPRTSDWTYLAPAAEIGPRASTSVTISSATTRMLFDEHGVSRGSAMRYADGVGLPREQGTHLRSGSRWPTEPAAPRPTAGCTTVASA